MSFGGQAIEEATACTRENIGRGVVINVGENGRCFNRASVVFYREGKCAFGLQDGVEAIEIEFAVAAKEDFDKSILVEVGGNGG